MVTVRFDFGVFGGRMHRSPSTILKVFVMDMTLSSRLIMRADMVNKEEKGDFMN